MHTFFFSNLEWYVFRFTNIQNSNTSGRNYKISPQARSFDGGPLPPSVYLGRHSRDNIYQAFPLCFCILQAIKNWTVGRPGNEATTLVGPTQVHTSCMSAILWCILVPDQLLQRDSKPSQRASNVSQGTD